MLFIIGILIALASAVIIRRVRIAGVNAEAIGWMSQQWIAEYRASHPT
jgi:hypothetical protein